MGLYSPKIDQYIAKIVKRKILKILKYDSFCQKNTISKQKLLFFKISHFTVFALSLSIFELYRPILPFWNSQSLIFKHMYTY